MVFVEIFDFPLVDVPGHEKSGQRLNCPPLYAYRTILPMAESFDLIDILIC